MICIDLYLAITCIILSDMSYSNKYDVARTTQRRQEEMRNLKTSKNAPIKGASSRVAPPDYEQMGKNTVNSPCAFHPLQKITNFCTNKECLLPLCPKCVKIHTDEHIKMGIFGEFDTIEQSLRLTEDGLRYSFEKLSRLETLMGEIKEAYEEKIADQRRKLREAKNYYLQQIQIVFEGFEKALISIESQQNSEFMEQLYNSDSMLAHLSDHFNKCFKKIGSSQTLMQGIINYFSQAEAIQRVEIASEQLQKIFPETICIVYHIEQLERIDSTIRRYLDVSKRNDAVWTQYKKINTKSDPLTLEKPKEYKKQQRISPIKIPDERSTPQRSREQTKQTSNSKNLKISQLGNLESNLNLGKFKSPLDNFSLANNRRKV